MHYQNWETNFILGENRKRWINMCVEMQNQHFKFNVFIHYFSFKILELGPFS